jgi:hypothetical protein
MLLPSAAEFFNWIGRKVLPRVGNTDRFTKDNTEEGLFPGVDLLSYSREADN